MKKLGMGLIIGGLVVILIGGKLFLDKALSFGCIPYDYSCSPYTSSPEIFAARIARDHRKENFYAFLTIFVGPILVITGIYKVSKSRKKEPLAASGTKVDTKTN